MWARHVCFSEHSKKKQNKTIKIKRARCLIWWEWSKRHRSQVFLKGQTTRDTVTGNKSSGSSLGFSASFGTTPHVSSDDRCIQNVFIITQLTDRGPFIFSHLFSSFAYRNPGDTLNSRATATLWPWWSEEIFVFFFLSLQGEVKRFNYVVSSHRHR